MHIFLLRLKLELAKNSIRENTGKQSNSYYIFHSDDVNSSKPKHIERSDAALPNGILSRLFYIIHVWWFYIWTQFAIYDNDYAFTTLLRKNSHWCVVNIALHVCCVLLPNQHSFVKQSTWIQRRICVGGVIEKNAEFEASKQKLIVEKAYHAFAQCALTHSYTSI